MDGSNIIGFEYVTLVGVAGVLTDTVDVPSGCSDAILMFFGYNPAVALNFSSCTLDGVSPFEQELNATAQNNFTSGIGVHFNAPASGTGKTLSVTANGDTNSAIGCIVFLSGASAAGWVDFQAEREAGEFDTRTATATAVVGGLVLKFEASYQGTAPGLETGYSNITGNTSTAGFSDFSAYSARFSYKVAASTSESGSTQAPLVYSTVMVITVQAAAGGPTYQHTRPLPQLNRRHRMRLAA